MRVAARRVLLTLLIGGVLVYGFAMRTGRYQITRMDTNFYLLLDTSTGATWVHRGELRDDRQAEELDGRRGPAMMQLARRVWVSTVSVLL